MVHLPTAFLSNWNSWSQILNEKYKQCSPQLRSKTPSASEVFSLKTKFSSYPHQWLCEGENPPSEVPAYSSCRGKAAYVVWKLLVNLSDLLLICNMNKCIFTSLFRSVFITVDLIFYWNNNKTSIILQCKRNPVMQFGIFPKSKHWSIDSLCDITALCTKYVSSKYYVKQTLKHMSWKYI